MQKEKTKLFKFRQDFYADVRVEDRFTTVISYVNGMLKEYKERCEKRAFIRVYDGKMWYYSSTTDINDVQSRLDALYLQAKPNNNILKNKIVRRFEVNSEVKMQFVPRCIR